MKAIINKITDYIWDNRVNIISLIVTICLCGFLYHDNLNRRIEKERLERPQQEVEEIIKEELIIDKEILALFSGIDTVNSLYVINSQNIIFEVSYKNISSKNIAFYEPLLSVKLNHICSVIKEKINAKGFFLDISIALLEPTNSEVVILLSENSNITYSILYKQKDDIEDIIQDLEDLYKYVYGKLPESEEDLEKFKLEVDFNKWLE